MTLDFFQDLFGLPKMAILAALPGFPAVTSHDSLVKVAKEAAHEPVFTGYPQRPSSRQVSRDRVFRLKILSLFFQVKLRN